jgi:HSP20 family protein
MALFRFSDPTDPGRGLLTLQRELERAFENPPFDLGLSGRGVFPPVNVFREKDGLILRVEIPGVQPERLSIETQARTLTITGVRESNAPTDASFHRRERDVGQFSRSVQLPEDVDVSRAQATYKYGILTVRIPKREEARPRQIAVQAG